MLRKLILCSIITAFFCSNLFSGSLSGRVNFEGKAPKKKIVEKHINNSQMKKLQAPMDARPRLVCWMEIN